MREFLAILALVASISAVHEKGVLRVADRRLVAGDTVQVSGMKFSKRAYVTMWFVGSAGRTRLMELRTDTAGRFRVAPLIPSNLSSGPYRLVVIAADGDEVGALDVEIVSVPESSQHGAHVAHADSMAEPTARPLALARAKRPWVIGGALAGIAIALVVGVLLIRRPSGAISSMAILLVPLMTSMLAAQQDDTAAVRRVVENVAAYTRAKDLAALDTTFARDAWVKVIEGAGVNTGWVDYRDNHLKLELADLGNMRYFNVEPQVRGNVAWAPFQYDLSVQSPQGTIVIEGRGTAVLEKRQGSWRVVHLHTSGRRRENPRE
jgi:ketosteroid isomerase-like protein